MVEIKINGKTLKELFQSWLQFNVRNAFCHKEIPQGKIFVAWRDVDDIVHGWLMSADDEVNLIRVAQMIADTKQRKLADILSVKGGEKHEGKG